MSIIGWLLTLALLLGCGGGGGDVKAAKVTTFPGVPGTTVLCDFGDNNTFSFVLGDNTSLDFCTQGGGTVKPDNSTVSQPTNSNNRTTNNVVPTPTPGGA